MRHRPCFASARVTCNCAVVFREFNNVLGVYACGADPVPVRYLVDQRTPADDIRVSSDGTTYTVILVYMLAYECSACSVVSVCLRWAQVERLNRSRDCVLHVASVSMCVYLCVYTTETPVCLCLSVYMCMSADLSMSKLKIRMFSVCVCRPMYRFLYVYAIYRFACRPVV